MSDIPVEDIAHRLKKAIKKLTTQQVEALIEVIDDIVTETKKESRAQALDECRQEIDNLKSEIACYEKYGLPHNPDGN